MSDDKPSRFKSDQLLEELESHVLDIVGTESGVSEAEARRVAEKVADRIWKSWGGQQVYISKQQPALQQRNAEIAAAFTGNNIDELVRHYHLSAVRIYAIIRTARSRRSV